MTREPICKDCPFGLKTMLFGSRIHISKECMYYSPTRKTCYAPRRKKKKVMKENKKNGTERTGKST